MREAKREFLDANKIVEDTPSEIPREETFHAFLDKVKFWINVCSEGENGIKLVSQRINRR